MSFICQPAFTFFIGTLFGFVLSWVIYSIADEVGQEPQVVDSYAIIQLKKRLDEKEVGRELDKVG